MRDLNISSHLKHLPRFLCFNNFLLFLIPVIVYSHDTLLTRTYGWDCFSMDGLICLLIDFMIRFTDFMLFLRPYIGYSHDTFQALTYGQDHFFGIIHV